jgi:protein-S-isoprenylcysteine O-methyltransferase Ste14
MSFRLFCEAIIKFILGVILVCLLLFIPGSISYWPGWLFIGILFIPMFIVGIIMVFKNHELLQRRLNNKEKENEQIIVVILSGLMFILGFILAGLNFRFNWFILPNIVIWIGTALFLVSYILYGVVMIQNPFLLRTIEVEKDQKLVDSGLYGIVRHPMYLVTIIMFLSIPLVLGSLISFIIFLIYPLIIIKRIKNEEKVLEKDLKGYKEYENKVKYRLIPYIW